MPLITFHFSFNHIFIILNSFTYYGVSKYAHMNFYYCVITILINWLICFLLSLNDTKSTKKEMINKIEITEKGFNVKKEKKINELNDKASFINRLIVIIIYIIYHFIPLFIYKIIKKSIYQCLKNVTILFLVLIYIILIKEKLYLHHFVSISFITFFIILQKDFYEKIINDIIPSIIFYLYTAFLKTYLKYLMQNKFITPYFCSFVSTFILTIKTYLTFVMDNKSINDTKFTFSYVTIIFFICNSLDCLFEHFVIYLFSPFHQVIAEIIEGYAINEKSNYNDIIIFIGTLFFILIYNEIIVLNFFGLGKNTKDNIKIRGELINKRLLESFEITHSYNNLDYNE